MIFGLISALTVSEGISLIIEGSAIAITTYYTAKAAKKINTRKK